MAYFIVRIISTGSCNNIGCIYIPEYERGRAVYTLSLGCCSWEKEGERAPGPAAGGWQQRLRVGAGGRGRELAGRLPQPPARRASSHPKDGWLQGPRGGAVRGAGSECPRRGAATAITERPTLPRMLREAPGPPRTQLSPLVSGRRRARVLGTHHFPRPL